MTKKSKISNTRALDLNGLDSGKFASIAETTLANNGDRCTERVFLSRFDQSVRDLRRICPNDIPINYIVEWPSYIRIRAVLMTSMQGALELKNSEGSPSNIPMAIEASAMNETEEKAAVATRISTAAVDTGNRIATQAEIRPLSLEDINNEMQSSQNENIARYVYGRSSSSPTKIYYPNGENRTIGGNKSVPTLSHSDKTFNLTRCNFKIIGAGSLELISSSQDDQWIKLKNSLKGPYLLKSEADSAIQNCLIIAAKAGILVDMTVCITQKIALRQQWLTPLVITNIDEVFTLSFEWLSFLKDNLPSPIEHSLLDTENSGAIINGNGAKDMDSQPPEEEP